MIPRTASEKEFMTSSIFFFFCVRWVKLLTAVTCFTEEFLTFQFIQFELNSWKFSLEFTNIFVWFRKKNQYSLLTLKSINWYSSRNTFWLNYFLLNFSSVFSWTPSMENFIKIIGSCPEFPYEETADPVLHACNAFGHILSTKHSLPGLN